MSKRTPREVYITLGDLSHDRELAQSLGDMIVAWSSAERVLIRVLIYILNIPPGPAATLYFRIPTFESRTKIIKALLDEWETKTFDPFAMSEAVTNLAKLSVTRNGWVHCVWSRNISEPRETVIYDHREKIGSPTRRRPVKAADVRNHNEAVRKRTKALWKLLGFDE